MRAFALACVVALLCLGGPDAFAAQVGSAPACEAGLERALSAIPEARVTLVRSFAPGEALRLREAPTGVSATHPLCMVKVVVGPGTQGPQDAPSTSQGIGIEVWLPASDQWNGRIHVLGGGGWMGGTSISSVEQLAAIGFGATPSGIADGEGSVSAVTDAGHTIMDGSFALLPDGTPNEQGWRDFAARGIHMMAVVTKALAAANYGKPAHHAYWEGCSSGGRQGLKEAQEQPQDFDGILAGAPAIYWSRFITGELYPQVVMQRDLGGKLLTHGQLDLASAAAVSACDTGLNGRHDGFLSDPHACRYDPTRDRKLLCRASGGLNSTADCLTPVQARALNKMWYGQTADGSVPDPRKDNGLGRQPGGNHLWYGLARGTRLASPPFGLADSVDGKPVPFSISVEQVALELGRPELASSSFRNAKGGGRDQWTTLGYRDLADAQVSGVAKQSIFSGINAEVADLGPFAARGGKLMQWHGLADVVIPSEDSDLYASRVHAAVGGRAAADAFYRYYPVPGMNHCMGVGSADGLPGVSPKANPPLPGSTQLFEVLVEWVEAGKAPREIVVRTPDGTSSRPLCAYPGKLRYRGGERNVAASYRCE